ncbi:hypothetical protein FACS1894137_04350 [Spirochaetia bacterium]|nr:hypothetical protein FACS1894137_04350 [Spirochaetia bacterium]
MNSTEQKKHALHLSKQICSITGMVMDYWSVNEMEAIDIIYSSNMYRLLSDETTKVWHYSTYVLFDILKTERETGNIANSYYVEGLVR